ncbi:hypothetical protein J6S88_02950 [bacterium]|nr:hypothetical protein [bacterium]
MGNPEISSAGWNKFTGMHSIQFLNGNNISGVKLGIGKNTPEASYSAMGLGGYDFGSKQPCMAALGSVEKKYNSEHNQLWLSRELYGEIIKEKGFFDSKLTYTPAKANAQVGKVNVSFDPRLAVHFNGDGVTPQVETLTTVAAPLSKDGRLFGYILFQTYGTENQSINFGFNYGI